MIRSYPERQKDKAEDCCQPSMVRLALHQKSPKSLTFDSELTVFAFGWASLY